VSLPPAERRDVLGLKGPAYKVGPKCCNPTCTNWADDPHHLWPRSFLGGAFDWVDIDGLVVANKVAVCRKPCHNDLTEDRAAIRLDERTNEFWWCLAGPADQLKRRSFHRVGLVEPQPLTPEQLDATLAPDQPGSETCPTCGAVKEVRRRRSQGTLRRRRATWLVKVPDDIEEDGAAVLDALVENLAPLVPNADASTVGRYYVLVPVLAYAAMNSKNFVETMEGIGG